MIRTLIIDDEPLAIEILETYVNQIPELTLAGKCYNAIEANRLIQQESIDLVFADIQMPQMTGIEWVRSLSNPPLVIFTTAYPEFAVQGFELSAVDYLLKPIAFDRFLKAVNKAMSQIGSVERKPDKDFIKQDFIFVKADKKLVKLHYDEILFIEGLKDYVIIYTDHSRIVTLQTMKSLEEKLPEQLFVRVHRSYIVNLEKINSIHSDDIEIIVKGQARQIPVGNNYAENFNKIISKKRI
ncbi:MAG: response regulator transcription factor [Saprospiraceae bacterium]|nr:response regulator transcription factor [Saprospiraceae bacterium]